MQKMNEAQWLAYQILAGAARAGGRFSFRAPPSPTRKLRSMSQRQARLARRRAGAHR